MDTICLVEAGAYLLGIDAAAIVQKMDKNKFLEGEQEDETVLISLASFFNQSTVLLPRPEFFVVEMDANNEPLLLLVDRIVGEIRSSGHFEPLPLLYSDLARHCCPQIMIHDEQPVLLLDGTGLAEVRVMLESTCGVFSMGTLREENRKNTMVEESPLQHSCIKVPPEQTAVKLDNVMFNRVVAWTIGKYLDWGNDENCTVIIDEFRSEYINSVQLQSISNDSLQYLIDKTIQQCREFHNTALQRLTDTLTGTTL